MKKNTNTDQAKTHQSLTMVYTPNFYHMQSLFLSLLDHCSFSCGQSYNGLEFEIVNEHTRCPGYFFLHAVDMKAVSLVTSRENSKYFQSFPLCRGRPLPTSCTNTNTNTSTNTNTARTSGDGVRCKQWNGV